MKNTRQPKQYDDTENTTEQQLNEPAVAYAIAPYNAATRTIGMMGMTGKKEFDAIRNENDFINVIRTGIPKQAMNNLMDVADLTLLEMASITHTSDRTLRRYKPQQKLSQEQSERMIELAKLYSRGEEVFETIAAFREWMNASLQSLGNKKPKDYLDTSLGINMLLDELGRIEHGIFA